MAFSVFFAIAGLVICIEGFKKKPRKLKLAGIIIAAVTIGLWAFSGYLGWNPY